MTRLKQWLHTIGIVIELTFKQTMTDAFILFTIIVQPLLIALLGLWMLQGKGPEYGIYVVVGSGMGGLWSSLLFISGNSINGERWQGTLESLVGVPTSLATIVFGKNIANVLQSLISMVFAYVLASLFFGYPLTISQPLPFVISLATTVVAFICFGLIIAPLFVLNPAVQQWQNGIEFPVYVLSGFLFPVAMLPVWSIPFQVILPTYWAAKALHASAHTGDFLTVLQSWGALGLCAAVCAACGGFMFKAMIRRAKIQATLDME